MTIRIAIIESPYAAPTAAGIARNRRYLNACILDCVRRGETPYASHKMLTDALDDANAAEREAGIKAGFDMREAVCSCDGGHHVVTAVYIDLGVSGGMRRGIEHADSLSVDVEERQLGGEWRL